KYFDTTTLVASTDQNFGTSTFSCLKITLPASSVISAVRRSHSIWSNGLTFASLKMRSTRNDLRAATGAGLVPREAATDEGRRRAACGVAATTSSLASIMFILRSVLGSADDSRQRVTK